MTSPEKNYQNYLRNVTKIHDLEKRVQSKLTSYKESAFERFPFLFIGLSTFGLVATLYGFEKIIDQFPILADNPWILLGTGVVILVFTGTLYNKLS